MGGQGPTIIPGSTLPKPPVITSTPPKESAKPLKKILQRVLLIIGIIIVIVAAVMVGMFVLAVHNKNLVTEVGVGMTPTIQDGQKVAALPYPTGQKPQRGDIVEFVNPENKTEAMIERVVAVPGDRITISYGTVTVYNTQHPNGYNPDAAYVSRTVTAPGNVDITVPVGEYYVLGDNRADALDSRIFGPVPLALIIGKVNI